MTRPLVVHVTTTDMSLELLLGPQLEAFAAAGYTVMGCSAPGPYVAALERRGIGHVPLAHATRSAAPIEDARALGELVRCFRRLRPAIVHTHNPKPGVYGRLAARFSRVPVVVNTVHGLYAQPDDRWRRRAVVYSAERIAASCSATELVQNPEDMETLARIGVPRRKLVLLGNGIDLGRFDPVRAAPDARRDFRSEIGATDEDVVVGCVGRLVAEKGYREVFAAARLVRERYPHVRFVVVGGPDPEKTDALTRTELDGAAAVGVQFLGSRDDVVRCYAGLDLYLLASHREGFPRAAMEASAMGLPIVATDIRGCRQVVDHGATGLLVPPRDPTALANAVLELVADPDRRARMGRAAKVRAATHFDQQHCIDVTLAVYERLLGAAA